MAIQSYNTEPDRINLSDMLKKLEQLYKEQDELIQQANLIETRFEQLKEDIEFLETMIMYKSNTQARKNVV